ncbi:hypothetical protein VHUM_01927 [Vanrija humicola]|uniref:Polysaccharide lyase family 8 protein n=1 Tax=Vanrija humicola TaxID=5417 RepID=A0A7D8Z1D4_VANHU|nr:hypothetical protein VHUM_01927 [Vanrija humicola]
MLVPALTALAFAALASADDFSTVVGRKQADIANIGLTASYAPTISLSQIPSWLATLTPEGKWPDVDYTSGCAADRAIWKAEEHLARVLGLGQVWSGLNTNVTNYANDSGVYDTAVKALDWWFRNDYNNTGCLVNGGKAQCPCTTPGMWNQNWFFQGIGVPTLVSEACLLLSIKPDGLSAFQQGKCLDIGLRGSIWSKDQVLAPNYQTGSNFLNMVQDAISVALYSNNETLLTQAYAAGMRTFEFVDTASQDGTHRDGSFLAHTAQLYNGAYGREVIKSFIQLQSNAVGTKFSAGAATQEAIAALIRGSDWQIHTNADGVLRWDLSVIGRYISAPLSDNLANAGLQFNATALGSAVADFTGPNDLSESIARLTQASNAKPLLGNKAYWAGDYMVHRRPNVTLFNKLISTRSSNAEFTNGANPLGYHINQGGLWSWVTENEYLDVTGAWDWYLVPGRTVLYHYPTLSSSWVSVTGKRDFVGVVSDGQNGFSVMDYIDPHDGSISYRRTWFFIDDVVVNTIANVSNNVGVSAPIVTVLDQRLSDGSTLKLDGAVSSSNTVTTAVTSLSYGGNGYAALDGASFNLTTKQGQQTGNWSALSVSTAGVTTKDIFTAYHTMTNGSSFSYAFYPGQEATTSGISTLGSNAVLGAAGRTYIAVSFWPGAANWITLPLDKAGAKWSGNITLASSSPAIYLLKFNGAGVTVYASDPTQKLANVTLTIATEGPKTSCGAVTGAAGCTAVPVGAKLTFALPSGGLAGSTVSASVTLGK